MTLLNFFTYIFAPFLIINYYSLLVNKLIKLNFVKLLISKILTFYFFGSFFGGNHKAFLGLFSEQFVTNL